jgi:hypothetical protein
MGHTAEDRGDAGDDRRGEVSEGGHGGVNPSTEEVSAGALGRTAERRSGDRWCHRTLIPEDTFDPVDLANRR